MLEARSQGGCQEYSPGEQGVRNLYRFTLFMHWLFICLQPYGTCSIEKWELPFNIRIYFILLGS